MYIVILDTLVYILSYIDLKVWVVIVVGCKMLDMYKYNCPPILADLTAEHQDHIFLPTARGYPASSLRDQIVREHLKDRWSHSNDASYISKIQQ